MKLNIGCGRTPLAGYVNLDIAAGPGVDVVWDLDHTPWPFNDESMDEIYASHVLEHVVRFDLVWSEIFRILRTGGTIHVRVPYKVNYDPYHIRYFSKASVERLTRTEHACLAGVQGGFERAGPPRVNHRHTGHFPIWHLQHYLHLDLSRLPLPWGWGRELEFTLRKTAPRVATVP